jgi:hypothetical protein
MAARSIVPELLMKLDPYLERLEHDWMAQPEYQRKPTLPLTPDGKVNVRQIVRDAGLRETQEQHFYRKPELAGPVNALARAQGVKPIGSRLLDEEIDEGVRRRFVKNADEITVLRRTLSEREALIESLRREVARLKSMLQLVEETGMIMRDTTAP